MATQILLKDATPGFTGEGDPKALIEAPKGGRPGHLGHRPGRRIQQPRGGRQVDGRQGLDDDGCEVRRRPRHLQPRRLGHPAVQRATARATPTPARSGTRSPTACGSPTAAAGRSSTSGRPSRTPTAASASPTRRPRAACTPSRSSTTCKQEVIFRNVSNWRIYALQTEEERAEGPTAFSTDIENCSHLTFANLWLFRVTIPDQVAVRRARQGRPGPEFPRRPDLQPPRHAVRQPASST